VVTEERSIRGLMRSTVAKRNKVCNLSSVLTSSGVHEQEEWPLVVRHRNGGVVPEAVDLDESRMQRVPYDPFERMDEPCRTRDR
jgi:hypothetical protein